MKDLDKQIPVPSDPVSRREIENSQNIIDAYRPYAIIASVVPGFTFIEIMKCETLGKDGGRVMGILTFLRMQGLIPEDYDIAGGDAFRTKGGLVRNGNTTTHAAEKFENRTIKFERT